MKPYLTRKMEELIRICEEESYEIIIAEELVNIPATIIHSLNDRVILISGLVSDADIEELIDVIKKESSY